MFAESFKALKIQDFSTIQGQFPKIFPSLVQPISDCFQLKKSYGKEFILIVFENSKREQYNFINL